MPVPKGSTLDPERTRAAILKAATKVLYERGLDGIGVSELCAGAGISKETLYRHFGSKGGLIEAVLRERSDRVTRWLADAAAGAGEDPEAQLAAVFDALHGWYAEPGFRGCVIVNAATQRHAQPPLGIASRHLGRRLELLTGIARQAGAGDPEALGRRLLMLLVGATVVADQLTGPEAAVEAKAAALALLRASR
jgi:AcrR family transcriptional regulator